MVFLPIVQLSLKLKLATELLAFEQSTRHADKYTRFKQIFIVLSPSLPYMLRTHILISLKAPDEQTFKFSTK